MFLSMQLHSKINSGNEWRCLLSLHSSYTVYHITHIRGLTTTVKSETSECLEGSSPKRIMRPSFTYLLIVLNPFD